MRGKRTMRGKRDSVLKRNRIESEEKLIQYSDTSLSLFFLRARARFTSNLCHILLPGYSHRPYNVVAMLCEVLIVRNNHYITSTTDLLAALFYISGNWCTERAATCLVRAPGSYGNYQTRFVNISYIAIFMYVQARRNLLLHKFRATSR